MPRHSNQLVHFLAKRCPLDRGGDHRDSVFLAGTARSGTTWLSEILNYDNRYRYMFEPFWPEQVRCARVFDHQAYVRAGNQDKKLLRAARHIVTGGCRSWWSDHLNDRLAAKRRLIKDVRANLMLGWLQARFPEMPLVFMMRHPCAVVRSWMKMGWRHWELLDRYVAQEELVEDHLKPFMPEISDASDEWDKCVLVWCIENYVALRQLELPTSRIILYENLVLEPEPRIRALFASLGQPHDERVFDAVQKPSPLTRAHSAIDRGDDLVRSWQSKVPPERAERTAELLALFGLDRIYNQQPMPLVDERSIPIVARQIEPRSFPMRHLPLKRV